MSDLYLNLRAWKFHLLNVRFYRTRICKSISRLDAPDLHIILNITVRDEQRALGMHLGVDFARIVIASQPVQQLLLDCQDLSSPMSTVALAHAVVASEVRNDGVRHISSVDADGRLDSRPDSQRYYVLFVLASIAPQPLDSLETMYV